MNDNIKVYDSDKDGEGCVRLYVNTDAPYSAEEVDRIGKKIEAVDDVINALRNILLANPDLAEVADEAKTALVKAGVDIH